MIVSERNISMDADTIEEKEGRTGDFIDLFINFIQTQSISNILINMFIYRMIIESDRANKISDDDDDGDVQCASLSSVSFWFCLDK